MSTILAVVSAPIVGVIAVMILVAFAADRLPKLARSAGRVRLEFLKGEQSKSTARADDASASRTRSTDGRASDQVDQDLDRRTATHAEAAPNSPLL